MKRSIFGRRWSGTFGGHRLCAPWSKCPTCGSSLKLGLEIGHYSYNFTQSPHPLGFGPRRFGRGIAAFEGGEAVEERREPGGRPIVSVAPEYCSGTPNSRTARHTRASRRGSAMS
jgi:hypothetical protein